MPIDIPRVSIRDLDRLVAAVLCPSLLYAANGTGGASSSLPNLVVSLPTVATNEVVEISLPPVASLLPVVSLPTVATNEVAEISLPTVATEIPVVSLPTVATDSNSQSTRIATTSGSAGNSSNEGPRALTVSDSLIDNCASETRIDHQVDDDNRRASPNSICTGSSESSQSNDKSRKRSRSPSDDLCGNFKKPTSQRFDNNRETSSRYGNNGERQQSRNDRNDDGQQRNRSSNQNCQDYSDNGNSNQYRNQSRNNSDYDNRQYNYNSMSNSNSNFQNGQGYNSRGNQNYEGFDLNSPYRFQNNDRELGQSSSQSAIYTKYLELQVRMLTQASSLQGPSINFSAEFSASNSNQRG